MMKINKSMVRLGLTVLGVLGIPITSLLSIKCHDKAKEVEDKKEKAKLYIPAMVSGVATAACVIGSHKVSSKEIAALSATASFAIANRNKLEEKVKEVIPDQKQAKEELTKSKAIVVSDRPSIESTGRGMLKCLEGYSGRLFYSSIEAVKSDEGNDMLVIEIYNYPMESWQEV